MTTARVMSLVVIFYGVALVLAISRVDIVWIAVTAPLFAISALFLMMKVHRSRNILRH